MIIIIIHNFDIISDYLYITQVTFYYQSLFYFSIATMCVPGILTITVAIMDAHYNGKGFIGHIKVYILYIMSSFFGGFNFMYYFFNDDATLKTRSERHSWVVDEIKAEGGDLRIGAYFIFEDGP